MKGARQRGFLLIVAVVLIVIGAILAAVMSILFVTNSASGSAHLESAQALFVAESGLERGIYALLSPPLPGLVACTAVTGNANLTDTPFGQGQYSVTGGTPFYPGAPATLNGVLTAAATVIPFTSSLPGPDFGMAPAGRVLIDREQIDYSAISTSATACGTAPCLVGVQRGRAGTSAAAHAGGTSLGQYQCTLQSQGGVPTLAQPDGKRTLQLGVTLEDGWIVGDRYAGSPTGWTFLRWDDPGTPDLWYGFTVNTVTFNAVAMWSVSMLSYADGWAVGNTLPGSVGPQDRRWNVFHWNLAANTWNRIPVTTNGVAAQNLYSVYMTSADDGWAVGATARRRWTLLHWDGTAWTAPNVNPGQQAQDLYWVYLLDTTNSGVADDGWAVGNNGAILRFQGGTTWSYVTGGQGNALFGVTCNSAADCWAVGAGEFIIHWNGSAWSGAYPVVNGTGNDLNSVICVSPTDCWAVGTGEDIVHWDGTNWTVDPNAGNLTGNDLWGVDCYDAANCWAVGLAGTMLHWDGTAWSIGPQYGTWGQDFYALSLVGGRQRPQSAWQEIFP